MIYGSYKEHDHARNDLYAYSRYLDDKKMLVVCSFSDKNVRFDAPEGFELSEGKLMLANYSPCGVVNNSFTLRPYETRVYLWE